MGKNTTKEKINGNFSGVDILSLDQFTPNDLTILFQKADQMAIIIKEKGGSDLLKNKLVTLLFYEPSSRTFSSFAAGIKRLGGATIEFQDMSVSSVKKGETLEDTIKVFESYSDAVIIRSKNIGTAQIAANTARVPILNAGDGTGEHPTQALLDLYTISKKFGKLDGLTGVIAGDLLNGRTVHSLLRGLGLYKQNTIYLLSPDQLRLTRDDFSYFEEMGTKLIEISSEKDIPKDADFWYWTRIQKERFENQLEYEKLKNTLIIDKKFLDTYANDKMILMHPLPRVGEISKEVDEDERAVYFRSEIPNGMYIRMALMSLILT